MIQTRPVAGLQKVALSQFRSWVCINVAKAAKVNQ